SGSTWRIANSVKRTPGGSANTIVAIAPGTMPTPKITMTGTKYTSGDRVCIKSQIGFAIRDTVGDFAAQIPIGTEMINAITTPRITRAIVFIECSHTSNERIR